MIKHNVQIGNHFNNCQIGCEVLSMSKRIMNEVMCEAEDIGCKIYYQDTDSIHMVYKDVAKLEAAFQKKYDRVLTGDGMGQFNIDFKSDLLSGELITIESIFLGKKCYLDVLRGSKSGELIDYHVRMKGVNGDGVKQYALANKMSILEIYRGLFKEEPMKFDLACGGKKIVFDYQNDWSIITKSLFERKICFKGKGVVVLNE